MNQIRIGNVLRMDCPSVHRISEVLEGKTYMDFHVVFVPIGGSFDVDVKSDYDCPESQFKDFVLEYLAYHAMTKV